jgi:lipoyl(octanoyl) transferase
MIEWKSENNPVAYDFAVETMEKRVADIRSGNAPELVWLLEHPPLYTAGTSAKDGDLLSNQFPVFKAGRGGEYTYHGPGQRVAYVMLDLKKHQGNMPDVRAYVCALEGWIIRTLGTFGVQGERRTGRIGIWVDQGAGKEDKIAAIGIRIRHWVTYHGIAINVNPDLSHFAGIVPCGIREHGVTSLHDLGKGISMDMLDVKLKENFPDNFKSANSPDHCIPARL